MENIPRIVYFSSATENTKRFVDKVGYPAERIELRKNDPKLLVDYDYVLVVPTYGGGHSGGAIPKQVIHFLNVKQNRDHCIGVIASGNINFGEGYGLAGYMIAQKLHIPLLYLFELMGTPEDVVKVQEGLLEFWRNNE